MFTRQSVGPVALLLLILMLSVCARDAAQAQERWPPWQTYGESDSQRAKVKRRAKPNQSEIDTLNRQVEQLRNAGKYAEATFAAQRALRLTEQLKGPNDPATAAALTTVADLYIAQGRLKDAEPLLKRSLTIREKSASTDSNGVAVALDNLAGLYDKQGRKADAEPLRQRAALMRGHKAGPVVVKDLPDAGDVARDKDSILARKSGTGGGAAPEPQAQNAPAVEKPAPPKARAYHYRSAPPAAARNGGEAPAEAPAPSASQPSAPEEGETASRSLDGGAPPEDAARAPETMAAPAAAPAPTEAPEAPEAPTPTMAPPPPPPGMAPEGRTAAEEEKEWDVVPVFYGTDREVEPNAKRLAFGSDRGRHLQLGRALVTVPKEHKVPNVERPWAISIPYFDVKIYEQAEDPKKHFTMQEIKKLSKEEFLQLVRDRLGGSNRFKDEAFVFVHGYNTAFDNAVYRTAQISYDLEFDGAPFLYSWPSGGGIASYTYDRESAEASKSYMRTFLDMVVKETGAKSVSIIAHSMGNQPLMDVLKDMKNSAPEGVAINQVILAAPDVDADSFADLAQAIKGLAKGVTLYVASNDRALMASRNFWGNYRAGDVPPTGPLVLSGIDTIDVSAASTDAFAINHSGYAQNTDLLKDIGELIKTGLRPPDQRVMRPERVDTGNGAYWRYAVRSR